MFVRYETNLTFRGTQHRKGIFAAMGDLKRMKVMSEQEYYWYKSTAAWFNNNLENPKCFKEPIAPDVRFVAQSWFFNVTSLYLEKSNEVAELLKKYGITVTIRLSIKPGKIIYSDNIQLVVVPNDS
ncbi:hypothetical protein ACNPKZ_04830 [Shewanella algae]|uniref:hypothetical protein n=1 Tax=Shewanella algae TaxID=38313 RepID=UPI003AAE9B2A